MFGLWTLSLTYEVQNVHFNNAKLNYDLQKARRKDRLTNGPTLHMNSKIKDNEWQKYPPRPWKAGGSPLASKKEQGPTMSESEVIFSQGEFLTGILDKNQYGATQYGLVHSFFELYGGDVILTLLRNSQTL